MPGQPVRGSRCRVTGCRRSGPIIRDWRAGLGFTVRAKLFAVAAITASFSFTLLLVVDSGPGRAGMITLAIAVITYIVSRPTKRLAPETE